MKTRVVERINRYCSKLRSFEVEYRRFGVWWYLADVDNEEDAMRIAREVSLRGFRGRRLTIKEFT